MTEKDRLNIAHDTPDSALVHTRDLDGFDIPDGQPDPRGWSVKSADGTTLGKVEDLIVDTGTQRVRYIEVKADGDISKHGGRDYFLLPIGSARLDDDNDDVVVQMDVQSLTGVPAYERGKVSREYETSLRDYVRERPTTSRGSDVGSSSGMAGPILGASSTAGALGGAGMAHRSTDRDLNFYDSPEYDDASFFSSRRNRQSGAMGATGSGAADRATHSGLGDRLADKVDDLKDRFDGNPASRPGPDATDRRI